MSIKSFLALSFLFLAAQLVSGFTIITREGERVDGAFVGEDQATIRIKDTNGVVRTFSKEKLDLKKMDIVSGNHREKKNRIQEKASFQNVPGEQTNPLEPSTPKQTKPVSGRLWSLQAAASNSYDTNINHNQEDIDSVGLVLGAGVRWQSNVSNPAFKAQYEAAKHSYSNSDQFDRISQNVNASYEWFFAKKMSLDIDSEASFKGSSEDREIGNQYTVEPQLKYKLNKSNRIEFYGAYRLKRYEDDPIRNAINRYLGIVYERRLFKKSVIGFEYRYEENDADSTKHDYYRRRYGVDYTIPFRSHDWLNVGFRYRQQNYHSRTVEINVENGPDLELLRRDQRYNFIVELAISITEDLQLHPAYQYESRNSNDVDKEFTSHYPSWTLVYRWR